MTDAARMAPHFPTNARKPNARDRWHTHVRSTDRGRSGRRLVLIVDDDRDTRETLAVLLALNGHLVRLACDGDQAIRAAEEFSPDIVFLDIGLPNGNGYAVCRRLRQYPALRSTLIFALSGRSGPEYEGACTEAGFDGCLTKPLEPSTLERLATSSR